MKWISVEDRLPEKKTDVQVFCSDTEEQFVAFLNRRGEFQFGVTTTITLICNPTHWMPLPESPEDE